MIAPAVAVICVLALWELVVGIGLLNEDHVPSMTATVAELADLFTEESFWSAVWISSCTRPPSESSRPMSMSIALVLPMARKASQVATFTCHAACIRLLSQIQSIAGTLTRTHPCDAG